jgi:hypothetical protein
LGSGELSTALASLNGLERITLVIGSAVIGGCFFAGQSIGYRGVFLLLVLPGLLAISRRPASRDLRALGFGTSVVIVMLMWGECLRLALYRALELPGLPAIVAGPVKVSFWLIRELGWWWTVSVMLTMLVDFLWGSPVLRWASSQFDRSIRGDGTSHHTTMTI